MSFRIPNLPITTTVIVTVGVIALRELAIELAADSIRENLWILGDFLAWRWSSVIVGLLAASLMIMGWAYLGGSLRLGNRPEAASPQATPDAEIVLLEPTDGAEVIRTFRLRGLAKTFEGNLVVEELGDDGKWSPLIVTTVGMLEGHSQFSLDLTLSPGDHKLRVGSSSGNGDWFGVEFRVQVENRPRILGQGMMQVEVSGLDRRGSYHRIPVDVVELLRYIVRYDTVQKRAPTGSTDVKLILGRSTELVEEEAEKLELVTKDLDPEKGWFVTITDIGTAFLAAYEDWLSNLDLSESNALGHVDKER